MTKEQQEAQILFRYEQLNAESIKKFLNIVGEVMENNRKHPYYNLTKGIIDSVYKFSNLSYKQFKSLYYFVNSCNKKTVGNTKSF